MVTPAYSDAQRIGNLGKRFFVGHHPDTWQEESEPKQGGDFGFDLSMWIEELGNITGRFSVQLKSTVDPEIRGSREESFVSVPLKQEVCNLYIQDGQPVMLVLIALDSDTSAESAKMFYTWIDVDIQNHLNNRSQLDESDPAEITFRIPIKNELTREVDISDYLKKYWSHTRLANSLRTDAGTAALKTVSALSQQAVTGLSRVTTKSLDKWLVNDALDGDRLWAMPKSGSITSKVKQISDYISHGNGSDADNLLSEIHDADIEDAEIRAELYFQRGRRSMLRGDAQAAHEQFHFATELQPDSPLYFCAKLETAVLINIGTHPVVPQELSEQAIKFSDDPDVKFQMMRIKALDGEYPEAEQILSELEGSNLRKARVLYAAIKRDWTGALEAADEGLAAETDTRQRRLLTVLQMRALLSIVTGDEDEVAVGGRADLDVVDANRLHDSTLEALKEAKWAGWPANSEMLLDCASVSCVVLGPNDNFLELISDFASKHPENEYAQETLARIATISGQPNVAIAAIKRLPNASPDNLARLVLLLGDSIKYKECVDLAINKLIDQPHSKLIDLAVTMAALSAYKLSSIHEESRLRSYVAQGSLAGRSLLQFIESNLKHPEERSAHLTGLWLDAMEGDGDETLQDNLFLYLRPDRDEDVDRLLTLGDIIQTRRGLTMMESAKYAAALLNAEKYEDAARFTNRAIRFFPKDENIGLVSAIALDRLGQSAAAEAVLRRFDGSTRKDLLHAHSNLLLRVGEVDTAVALVKNALANAIDHKDKFYFQRTLSILYGKLDPDQYVESIWRLGEIADRAVEEEEGSFLSLFAMATSGPTSQLEQNRVLEFRERIKNFSERYPNSQFFRIGTLPDSDSGESLIASLHKMLGLDEKAVKEQERLRNIGETRGSLITLALRPGGIAPYATNIIDLLSVSINGVHDGESSKIIVGNSSLGPSDFRAPPIIDLATLAVLVELDIFDKLFSIWTAIAIPKISLQVLSELSFQRLTVSSNALVGKVTEAIRRHKADIIQPGAQIDDDPSLANCEHKTISESIRSGEFDFLTFDISAGVIIENEMETHGRCHSLWDFLRTAERRGVINAIESRLIRLRIASWNTVGTPLEQADIAAATQGAMAGDARNSEKSKAAARAARRFITEVAGKESIQRAASVVVAIATSDNAHREGPIKWFARICYREFVLAGSAKFTQSADSLTAQLLAYVAADLYGHQDGFALAQMIWRELGDVRVAFGGSEDRSMFLRSMGRLAANLFDNFVKKGGTSAMITEAVYRELLFSGITPGTHDRDVIEKAYFERTVEIQSPS